MKNKFYLILFFMLSIILAANAEYGFDSASDYTGEAFFGPPVLDQPEGHIWGEKEKEHHGTVPLFKQIRLDFQERARLKEQQIYELAPTSSDVYAGEVGTSEYVSKEIVDDFDEINPDGFEADNEVLDEPKKEKEKKKFLKKQKKETIQEPSENIILDCEKVDYDTNNYTIIASGNVTVEFIRQKIIVKADNITFDRARNTIKAEGNVRIYKSGRVITGDYIFVDMNEETALIENPLSKSASVEIKSQKGIVTGDKIIQEKGSIIVRDTFPLEFQSAMRGPQLRQMLLPKKQTLSEDMAKGIITLQTKDIKIEQNGLHEIITLTKPRLYKGDKLIFKTPSVKFYTNKNRDYVENNHWELGSIRGLGMFAGPGFVTKLPPGSVFKFLPTVNYRAGFGYGGIGRFHSATNQTTMAYGTVTDKFLVYGKQDLDDHLYLQYAHNAYMSEWFMGRRRPKYGVSMVYEKAYASKGFLLKNQSSSFRHRFDAGYFHDLDFDSNYEKIPTSNMGTSRFKYMAQVTQNFFEYQNKEELKAFRATVVGQFSSGIYGTGDTQVIGRVGPLFHTQYKRWMQDIGFFFTVYDDNTPLRMFDSYRYGKESIFLREYFRICRWLTVSWFGMINVSDDAPNGKAFQENGFYFSFGPDDLKVNLGYDFIRSALRCTLDVMMDAKGTKVEYEKFEITQKKTDKKKDTKTKKQKNSSKIAPTKPVLLDRAVVEYIKEQEDVL